jgi:hypothetical protein
LARNHSTTKFKSGWSQPSVALKLLISWGLNLKYLFAVMLPCFLSGHPLQCRPLPLSCCAVVLPHLLLCCPLPCHPLLYHPSPLMSCRPSHVLPPSHSSRHTSLVLAGCCIASSLVAPTSLSRQLVVELPPLLAHCRSHHAAPLLLLSPSLIAPRLSHHASLSPVTSCQPWPPGFIVEYFGRKSPW